jgi:hypothetical protein
LANGCCCNRKTIAALTIAVNGSDKDGHPGERSDCVRALAFLALQRCLYTYTDPEPVRPPEPPTPPAAAAAGGVQLAVFYRRVERDTSATVVADAREAVARGMNLSVGTIRQLSGQTTLVDVLSEARRPVVPELRVESAAPPAAPPDPAVAVAPTQPDAAPRPPGTLFDVWQRAADRRPK